MASNEFSDGINSIRESVRTINSTETDAAEKIEEIASALEEITNMFDLLQDAFRALR